MHPEAPYIFPVRAHVEPRTARGHDVLKHMRDKALVSYNRIVEVKSLLRDLIANEADMQHPERVARDIHV